MQFNLLWEERREEREGREENVSFQIRHFWFINNSFSHSVFTTFCLCQILEASFYGNSFTGGCAFSSRDSPRSPLMAFSMCRYSKCSDLGPFTLEPLIMSPTSLHNVSLFSTTVFDADMDLILMQNDCLWYLTALAWCLHSAQVQCQWDSKILVWTFCIIIPLSQPSLFMCKCGCFWNKHKLPIITMKIGWILMANVFLSPPPTQHSL